MSRHGQRLAQRRRELVERCAAQRAALARDAAPLLHCAALIDRGIALALESRKLLGLAARAATLYMLLRR
jgi:hypothetical protein